MNYILTFILLLFFASLWVIFSEPQREITQELESILRNGQKIEEVFPDASLVCIIPEYTNADRFLHDQGLNVSINEYVPELWSLIAFLDTEDKLFHYEFIYEFNDGHFVDMRISGCFPVEKISFESEIHEYPDSGNNFYRIKIIQEGE